MALLRAEEEEKVREWFGELARPVELLVADAGSGTLTIVEDLLSGRPPAPAREAPSPLLGRSLPEFSLVDLHTGELRSSREWAEKRYIVNFFASW